MCLRQQAVIHAVKTLRIKNKDYAPYGIIGTLNLFVHVVFRGKLPIEAELKEYEKLVTLWLFCIPR